jgi:hypothetical protein
MTDASLTSNRVAGRRGTSSADTPEVLAEQHLMRRILIATAIAMPIGATVFALLVAGIGILAGSFFGMWAGFVASVSELDEVDLHLHR